MDKRGAYFFVIDVFVASAIIIIALVLIFNFFLNRPEMQHPRLYASDVMSFLLSTEVGKLQNTYVESLIKNGNITNTKQSLFSQILEFHKKGKDDINRLFIHNITTGLIPKTYGIEYTINGTSVYNKSLATLSTATFSVSAKRICFLRINSTEIYGPVMCEVQVWD